MNLKKISQAWNYFKRGRGEIGLLISLYNMSLTYSIRFDVSFSIVQYATICLVFGMVCILIGIFLVKKVEPQNNVISPYAQDGLTGAIHLHNSLTAFYKGDVELALEEIGKAKATRKKWLAESV